MNNSKNINLAIVGSRTFNDYQILVNIINQLLNENNFTINKIISGGAKGADTLGFQYAEYNNIPALVFKTDWKKYGKRAGFIRNVDIINNCDICIAFWDGESHGTKHVLELCVEQNKPCFVYNFIEQKFYRHIWKH